MSIMICNSQKQISFNVTEGETYTSGRVIGVLKENNEMAAPQFKELTGGVSRKYLIPLLEYFDSKNVTIRVGDTRQLRGTG